MFPFEPRKCTLAYPSLYIEGHFRDDTEPFKPWLAVVVSPPKRGGLGEEVVVDGAHAHEGGRGLRT